MKCPYCSNYVDIDMEKTDWKSTGVDLIEYECVLCGFTDWVYLDDGIKSSEELWE